MAAESATTETVEKSGNEESTVEIKENGGTTAVEVSFLEFLEKK